MKKNKTKKKFSNLDDALLHYAKWNRHTDNLEELLELRAYISLQLAELASSIREDEIVVKKLKAKVALMSAADKRASRTDVLYAAQLDGKVSGTKFYIQTMKETLNSIASWINQLSLR